MLAAAVLHIVALQAGCDRDEGSLVLVPRAPTPTYRAAQCEPSTGRIQTGMNGLSENQQWVLSLRILTLPVVAVISGSKRVPSSGECARSLKTTNSGRDGRNPTLMHRIRAPHHDVSETALHVPSIS